MMPISIMAQIPADQFDSKKAYQAQEEQTSFVSLSDVFAGRVVI